MKPTGARDIWFDLLINRHWCIRAKWVDSSHWTIGSLFSDNTVNIVSTSLWSMVFLLAHCDSSLGGPLRWAKYNWKQNRSIALCTWNDNWCTHLKSLQTDNSIVTPYTCRISVVVHWLVVSTWCKLCRKGDRENNISLASVYTVRLVNVLIHLAWWGCSLCGSVAVGQLAGLFAPTNCHSNISHCRRKLWLGSGAQCVWRHKRNQQLTTNFNEHRCGGWLNYYDCVWCSTTTPIN